MAFLASWINHLTPVAAALLATTFATFGWIYTCRRNRLLSKKQHTFNALLKRSFNEKYHTNQTLIVPILVGGGVTDEVLNAQNGDPVRDALKFILNYYEFIAAGVRNGDICEKLLKDSERGTIVRLYQVSQKFIGRTRDDRQRRSTFEHLEWIYVRWHERPPTILQRIIEFVLAKPLYHERHKWVILSSFLAAVLALFIAYLHLPGEAFNQMQTPPAATAAR